MMDKDKIRKIIKTTKFKIIFSLVFGIWFIDYLTTFVALNFMSGLIEGNKIMAYLYSLGWYGWILSPLFAFGALSIFTMIVYKTSEYIELTNGKTMAKILLILPIGTFIILESTVIINNLSLILERL